MQLVAVALLSVLCIDSVSGLGKRYRARKSIRRHSAEHYPHGSFNSFASFDYSDSHTNQLQRVYEDAIEILNHPPDSRDWEFLINANPLPHAYMDSDIQAIYSDQNKH